MVDKATTAKAKKSTARKRSAVHEPPIRELDEEEIYVDESATGAKRKQVHWSYPDELTRAWDHLVNAENEFWRAVLSLLGLQEQRTETHSSSSRRSPPEHARHEEHIEVREVRVE